MLENCHLTVVWCSAKSNTEESNGADSIAPAPQKHQGATLHSAQRTLNMSA
jgi:hypothetical protein